MEYYIQGNKEKADQIKAAFEKLGYDISWPEGCANPDVINIGVERNGAKYVVAETAAYIRDIIKTHPDYQELELPKPHYDIANFQPFDKVLVRDDDNECWMPSLFGWFDSGLQDGKFVCGTSDWEQCIPFEGNEHLLGTTNMCPEEYINW